MHHLEQSFFTVNLALHFNTHSSSTASLDIRFHHHIYILTFVAVAVHKTGIFVPHTFCFASMRTWTTQKNDFIRI